VPRRFGRNGQKASGLIVGRGLCYALTMSNRNFDNFDILIGTAKDVGGLYLSGNAKARDTIKETFPSCSIEWDAMPKDFGFPPDWKLAEINLPKLIAACPDHKLKMVEGNPNQSLNVYGQRLGVTLLVAGCRVVIEDATGKFNPIKLVS
jgi:hypothetical protein